jgi:FMN phosphatase YigB (HAD superfamily)
MIKAILFDLYETLVTERGTTPVRASSLADALGIAPAAFRPIWKRLRHRVVRGDLSFASALTEVGTQLGIPVAPSLVADICAARVREKASLFKEMDPGLVEIICRLYDRDIRLAVVSNCFAEDVAAWPGCALAPWFAAAVFSCEVGAAKPEPAIYLEAARRLGVEPGDALFIGDGGDDELLGAERAGLQWIQAAWFRGDLGAAYAPATRSVAAYHDVLELV